MMSNGIYVIETDCMLPVDALTPYSKNAKKHPKEQIEEIKASIRHFGMDDPIGVWGDKNLIVEGHGRLIACKELGIETVPCIRLDHLTAEQRKAYTIAHNKTNMDSGFDMEILEGELAEITEIDMSDFGDFGLGDASGQDETVNNIKEDEYDGTLPDIPKAKRGDVYALGNHRLMCGDSTILADVEKLMGGHLADLVVTEPPYNMGYCGAGGTRTKQILNDKMSEDDFARFLSAIYANYLCSMKDGATIYVFYKELGTGIFITAMSNAGLTYKQELIWVKNSLVLGGSKYQSMYEPFLMGCKGKKIAIWNGKRKERSVIESVDLMDEEELRKTVRDLCECIPTDVIRENKTLKNDLHPTMKPVRLIGKLIINSSNKGDTVLDLFGGSGTTLIAAEQLQRNAYLMELDPQYVDVIIDRWEKITGRKAVLLESRS